MKWIDIKEGDVLLGNDRALLFVKVEQTTTRQHPQGMSKLAVNLTSLDLVTGATERHDRCYSTLSPTYTILRGHDVVQEGDGE